MLRYAVLAPSSRNAQPWIWEAAGNRLDLYADWDRALPVSDPTGRELLIGCGAALLHLRAALRRFGYAGDIELFPSAQQSHLLARVRLGDTVPNGPEWEVLFSAISQRRTNRHPFENKPLPEPLAAALGEEAQAEGAWLHLTRRGRTRSVAQPHRAWR